MHTLSGQKTLLLLSEEMILHTESAISFQFHVVSEQTMICMGVATTHNRSTHCRADLMKTLDFRAKELFLILKAFVIWTEDSRL